MRSAQSQVAIEKPRQALLPTLMGEYQERLGISYMLTRFDWTPGLPQDEILASMRLFGEKVIQKL